MSGGKHRKHAAKRRKATGQASSRVTSRQVTGELAIGQLERELHAETAWTQSKATGAVDKTSARDAIDNELVRLFVGTPGRRAFGGRYEITK